jgi:glycosyltransferase involved in cell wall biosynthesis
MAKTKVLYVLHNHPAVFPGGAEMYALELFEALRGSDEIEPVLVARADLAEARERGLYTGATFKTVEGDPQQYFMFTEFEEFDPVLGTSGAKSLFTQDFANFLRAHQPDVVHFQHTHIIGYDIVTMTRRVLPHVPILYTLHEYLPICLREGQMIRTERKGNELCTHASPRRCNECFPGVSTQQFFMREKFIKGHLENVDLFLAPSRFLRQRYIDWGIPAERILFEELGRRPTARVAESAEERPRNRLGFFGQLTPFKGAETLLRAMKILAERRPDVHLNLHGAYVEYFADTYGREFLELVEQMSGNVTYAGAYEHSELPRLMHDVDWVVLPSRWWENSPLVVQEAFTHGRPVICSGIGGLAEKVHDEVNGLHFNVGDPDSLASVIERAVTEPGLWERLRAGIPHVYTVDQHVESLTRLYRELLEQRSGQAVAAAPAAP